MVDWQSAGRMGLRSEFRVQGQGIRVFDVRFGASEGDRHRPSVSLLCLERFGILCSCVQMLTCLAAASIVFVCNSYAFLFDARLVARLHAAIRQLMQL